MRAALIAPALLCLGLLCAAITAGCGSASKTTAPRTTTTVALKRTPAPASPSGMRVGVVGTVDAQPVPGARISRGGGTTLATAPADPLVLVSAQSADLAALEATAKRYPTSHYAYVGGSTKGHHQPNLVGLVLNDEQAALLGGAVAGLVAGDQGGVNARIAWVGPEERALVAAFTRGAHHVQPGATVLRAWSQDHPASCKEAALGAIARGAVAVMAHGGLCAAAAIAGAHQQNRVGLQISDFELPEVPIGVVVRDAVAGVYRGGEDVVFGASSGAIGVRHLDPRISPDIAARARALAQQLASGVPPSA